MSIRDMKLFSMQDIEQSWNDICSKIMPLAAIHPQVREQILDYFQDVLLRRSFGDDSFLEEPQPIKVNPVERKEES